MNNKQNAERAKKVINSWPEWKRNFQLTKYKKKSSEQDSKQNRVIPV